jgi:hypothetical protein
VALVEVNITARLRLIRDVVVKYIMLGMQLQIDHSLQALTRELLLNTLALVSWYPAITRLYFLFFHSSSQQILGFATKT